MPGNNRHWYENQQVSNDICGNIHGLGEFHLCLILSLRYLEDKTAPNECCEFISTLSATGVQR